jgi:ATP-dependent Clp protease ATP-binding subunit ClpC
VACIVDIVLVWLLVFVIAGAAVIGLRRLRGKVELRPDTPPAPEPAIAPKPDAARETNPLALAKSIETLYEASPHPSELLGRPEFEDGVNALCSPAFDVEQVATYGVGANDELGTLAAEALARRNDGAHALDRSLAFLIYANFWRFFFLMRLIEAHASRTPVIARVVVNAREWWSRNPSLPKLLSDFIDRRMTAGDALDLDAAFVAQPEAELTAIQSLLNRLTTSHAAELQRELDRWQNTRIDQSWLRALGRVWDTSETAGTIVQHARLQTLTESAKDSIARPRPQSLLVTGEAGTGKTALVGSIATQLAKEGWTVFECTAADLLSGQSYIGELEQRMRELQLHLDTGRKVLWYAPQFQELYYAGRHRFSPQGILDLLLPAVEAGRICIVGELLPAALERVLQERPRVRLAFKVLTVDALSADESIALAQRVCDEQEHGTHVQVPAPIVREALDLGRSYLSNRALPGALMDLLRTTLTRLARDDGSEVVMRREDLLTTLTQLTGLPNSVLDEREGLQPAQLAAFFEKRVMGQPEAVTCLVDRVAMLKAGLTDPQRPIGVFLFAGPTGTGKTEVAKVLAEFLFGSQERMLRLDMSELQEPSAVARIVGDGSELREAESLATRIRKQPFSVILLDEFEKAHPRVWDLFLQVFDDGRLTDAHGNAADFRHSIIILTSNLGAIDHQGTSLGFTDGGGAFGEAQVLRTIAKTFRPEFVNRIDRVVVFRPLSRAVMRDILKKELREILQRRGFRSREWAVEWEESALEFLLDKGFTRDMGARPLRRAIEQYLLAPLAMSIVEHRFPEGDQFLFVRSDGHAIQVEFVDPDAPSAPNPAPAHEATSTAGLDLASLILAARGTEAERMLLAQQLWALDARLTGEAWVQDKAQHLASMNRSSFWSDPARFDTLSRIELMDRIAAGAEHAHAIMRRLDSRAEHRQVLPGSLLSTLAQQLYLLQAALRDYDGQGAPEVFVAIEPIAAEGAGARPDPKWAQTLSAMYQEWGRKRRMRMNVLRESGSAGSEVQSSVLAVSGFGVHAILQREAGLHVMEIPEGGDNVQRVSARVRVAAQPAQPRPASQSELEFALACLTTQAANTAVVRRYRREPSPLVRDAVAGWRTGRLDQVLSGDFDVMR